MRHALALLLLAPLAAHAQGIIMQPGSAFDSNFPTAFSARSGAPAGFTVGGNGADPNASLEFKARGTGSLLFSSPLVSGPGGDAAGLNVTPTGGTQTTLGAALAAAGCTTNCTFGGTTNTTTLGAATSVVVGGGSANVLTITPGGTSSSTINLTKSGSGDLVLPGSYVFAGSGTAVLPKLNVSNGATISWAGATAPTGFSPVRASSTMSGAPTSGVTAQYYFAVTSDTVDGSNSANAPSALRVDHNFGGSGMNAGRNSFMVQATQTGAVGAGSGNLAAGVFFMNAGAFTNANAKFYALNPQVIIPSGATAALINGAEFNLAASSGATYAQALGLDIILESGHQQQGTSGKDSAFLIGAQAGAGAFFNRALTIGGVDAPFPLTTGATAIKVDVQNTWGASNKTHQLRPPKMFAFADMSNVNFTIAAGFSLKMPGFSTDGTGQITMANALIGTASDGVKIDVPNQIVTAVAVSAGGGGGGSGTNDYYVGDILYDAFGGQYSVTAVSSGAVSGVSILVPGVAATAQSNPTAATGGSGVNASLTLTWGALKTLTLQPSGGATAIGGTLGMSQITTGATAPGAAKLRLEVVAGTNAGSLKIIAYGGTSTTPVTVADNIGTGS